eukprot:gene30171-biopygen16027
MECNLCWHKECRTTGKGSKYGGEHGDPRTAATLRKAVNSSTVWTCPYCPPIPLSNNKGYVIVGTTFSAAPPKHAQNREANCRYHRTRPEAEEPTGPLEQPGEAELLGLDLERAGVHACGLQEIREAGSGSRPLIGAQGWSYHWSGHPAHYMEGVGLMIHPRLQKHAMGPPTAISDRLMHMSFNSPVKVTLVVAYAPTEAAHPQGKEAFYQQPTAILPATPTSHCVFILGDLNAQGGHDRETWPQVVGRYGTFSKATSAHPPRPIEAANEPGEFPTPPAMGALFPVDNGYALDRTPASELAPSRFHAQAFLATIFNSPPAKTLSQHHGDAAARQDLKTRSPSSAPMTMEDDASSSAWTSPLPKADALLVAKEARWKYQDSPSETTQAAMEEADAAFRAANRECRRSAMADLAAFQDSEARCLQEAYENQHTRVVFNKINILTGRTRAAPIASIKSPTGDLTSDPQTIANFLATHSERTLNVESTVAQETLAGRQLTGERKRSRLKRPSPLHQELSRGAIPPPSGAIAPIIEQVIKAIQKLKNTAPGNCAVAAQMLKLGGHTIASGLHRVISVTRASKLCPQS